MSSTENIQSPRTRSEKNTSGYSQKFCLQRRDHNGFFVKVKTFSEIIRPEQAFDRFGPGYYVLRATKPRFVTIWKQKLGNVEQTKELRALKEKTKYLTYGFVGVAATEAIGFGLTHWRFSNLEKRVDTIETVLQAFKPAGLQCAGCGKTLDFYLQKFCSQCGAPTIWPRKYLPVSQTIGECVRCNLPLLAHQVFCPNCGETRPLQVPRALQQFRIVSMSN